MKGAIRKGTNAPANTVRIVTGRLGGKWLERLDYTPGEVLTISAAPGLITYERQENGIARTLELVRFARANKLWLIQVQTNGGQLFIKIPNSCFKRANISPEEPLFAIYEHGLLKLQKPELS